MPLCKSELQEDLIAQCQKVKGKVELEKFL